MGGKNTGMSLGVIKIFVNAVYKSTTIEAS